MSHDETVDLELFSKMSFSPNILVLIALVRSRLGCQILVREDMNGMTVSCHPFLSQRAKYSLTLIHIAFAQVRIPDDGF